MNSLDPKSSIRGSCNARVLIQPEQGTGSEIAQPNTENLINSVQTMRGSTQFPPDLRTRHPNPTESQPRTHGGPTHYTHTQDQANVERFRRRVGRPNRVPRHSSCERRGARPSLGQRGSWRAPRTATAAAAAATARRRRQRGQGRPSRHLPRRRRWGDEP
jgi:hypothetical protein